MADPPFFFSHETLNQRLNFFDQFAPGVADPQQGGTSAHLNGDIMASSVTDKLSFHAEQRSLADNPHPDIFLVLQFFGINEPRPLDLRVGGPHEILHLPDGTDTIVGTLQSAPHEIRGKRNGLLQTSAPFAIVVATPYEKQIMDGVNKNPFATFASVFCGLQLISLGDIIRYL